MHPVAVSPKPSPRTASKKRTSSGVRLLELAVVPGTLKRYLAATVDFVRWAIDQGDHDDPDDDGDFDDWLLEYIGWLWDEGRSKSKAKATLNGICLYLPGLREQLPKCHQAIRGWHKSCPSQSHPPLTWELTAALAAHLAARPEYVLHGIATVISFDCLLRVSEMTNLRREDVGFGGDPRLGGGGSPNVTFLAIKKAKTGRNQWVSLTNPALIALLREVVATTEPGQLLFPFSSSTYRRVFKQGCADLGLSSLYVPHSLRHGGATRYKHKLGWTMEDVMLRGRWASSKSARIYIQAGVAMALAVGVPTELHLLGSRIAASLGSHLSLKRHRTRK